jgi:hypothetical protein
MNEWAKKAYYAPQRNEVSEFRNGSEADIAPVNVMQPASRAFSPRRFPPLAVRPLSGLLLVLAE